MPHLEEKIEEIVPEYWKNLSLENIVYINDEGVECIEEWRGVVGYENRYLVSDCGRIKTIARKAKTKWISGGRYFPEKIKPSFDDGKGYRRVEISKDGINTKYFVHQLEGIAFIPNPENKPQINHIWGNKSDNRKSRLEWATKSEDRQHALKVLGAKTGTPWKNCNPKDHPMFGRKGKLAPSSRPIICNETGIKYVSIREAAKDLHFPETTLKYVLMGLTKKSRVPYTFQYI